MSTNVIEKLLNKKAGTFFRIQYTTKPELNKLGKAENVTITKITSKFARTGVTFANISGVNAVGETNGWWHYIVKNRLVQHNTNGRQYIAIQPTKNSRAKTVYTLNGEKCTYDSVAKYLKQSNAAPTKFQLVSVDNIISIS